jgi:hypothetical protein
MGYLRAYSSVREIGTPMNINGEWFKLLPLPGRLGFILAYKGAIPKGLLATQ